MKYLFVFVLSLLSSCSFIPMIEQAAEFEIEANEHEIERRKEAM